MNRSARLFAAALLCLPLVGALPAQAGQPVNAGRTMVGPSGGLSAQASYRLSTATIRQNVVTPKGEKFQVNATYPVLKGPKSAYTKRFNKAVAKQIASMKAVQAASIDRLVGCPNADLTGSWQGQIVKARYVSVMLDWDRGDCGGVNWNSDFGSVTFSLKSGKLRGLQYMLGKFSTGKLSTSKSGPGLWDAVTLWMRVNSGPCPDPQAVDSLRDYEVGGWRVTSDGAVLAWERYQAGMGACGSPSVKIPWSEYRLALETVRAS